MRTEITKRKYPDKVSSIMSKDIITTISLKEIKSCCYSRVGLLGNPSDGFNGKTLSFLLKNFKAVVNIVQNNKNKEILLKEEILFTNSHQLIHNSISMVILFINLF